MIARAVLLRFVLVGVVSAAGLVGVARGLAAPSPFLVYVPFVPNGVTQYFDDFSDPSSGWPSGSNSYDQYGYLNGEYQILVHTSSTYLTLWPGVTATNFSERVDARYASGNAGAYGLAFNINGTTGSYSYYIFIVAPFSQQFGIFEKLNGTWLPNPVVPWTASTAINAAQASNHLVVVRNGSTMQAWINGSQVASTTNSDSLGGAVGLYNETYLSTTEADARFDNFGLAGIDQISSLAMRTAPSGRAPATPGRLVDAGVAPVSPTGASPGPIAAGRETGERR